MPGVARSGYQIGEGISRRSSQVAGLADGENALCVESYGEFASKARLNFGVGELEAGCHRFRDVEMQCQRYLLF